MNKILVRIDVQKLAGLKHILGVDLTESRVHIVELENRGNVLNKFRPVFKVVRSFSHELDPQASLQERAATLRALLIAQKVTARFAVTSLQSFGTKVTTAEVPNNVESIDEWLRERSDKLLKLPIPQDQVLWEFEVMAIGDTVTTIEVSFVRRSEVKACQELFHQAAIPLMALACGTRDALNPFLLSRSPGPAEDAAFVYLGEGITSISPFQGGKRLQTRSENIDKRGELEPQILGFIEPEEQAFGKIVLSGELGERSISDKFSILKPLGISPEYTLAVGLAIKGFLPELSPTNFLEEPEKGHVEKSIYRLLSRKVVLALGALIILLLGGEMLIRDFIHSELDALDEQVLSSGSLYADVTRLEEELKTLEIRIGGSDMSQPKTNYARILHELAALTPDSVWLDKLSIIGGETGYPELSLNGYAPSNEYVAEFLKNLRVNGLSSEVNLVRSGSSPQSDRTLSRRRHGQSFVTFEVRAKVKG